MNTRAGYGSTTVLTARDTEYQAFSRVTRMLRQAARDGSTTESIMAIHKNNELWTLLASDLASPGNGLPEDLKARLLSLSIFSLRHGHAVLGRKATSDALIDINMSIMKGLRGDVAA